jgi:ELWxxDGT repeat protein
MHPDDDWALWATDLTTAGTARVADIDQQVSGIWQALLLGSNLRAGPFGGRLLFGADGEDTGIEPWITDGTKAGTELLADLKPGSSQSGYPYSSYPVGILADAGVAVIAGQGGLWATDGSAAGTIELRPDFSGSTPFTRPSLAPSSTTEIFLTEGMLTVTDGTPGGTITLESDVDSGRALVSQGTIFLNKFEPPTGVELWVTTGEPNAATLLRDILPGADSSYPELLAALGGTRAVRRRRRHQRTRAVDE